MRSLAFSLLLACSSVPFAFAQPAPVEKPPGADDEKSPAADAIDFERARALIQKMRRGETLSQAEREYVERARAARREGNAAPGRPQNPARPQAPAEPKASLDLVPLTELTGDARYKERTGGLYGDGSNEIPAAHRAAAERAAALVQPLDAAGRPDPNGKVVLISNGMSNTTQEFQAFENLARGSRDKSPSLVIVDGAQGGMEASDWARPGDRFRGDRPDPWTVLDERLERAGVSPLQVQVVWIKQARRNPASLGEFPDHAKALRDDLATLVGKLKERFPNLLLAYVSSRIYAGQARGPLNPEPYAYESGFAVQQLIRDQIAGDEALNHDPERGKVLAPVLLWGPYLWSNGTAGRAVDDLVWNAEDFAGDGTHPSDSGRRKVAEQLLRFFTGDPTAKPWFTAGDE